METVFRGFSSAVAFETVDETNPSADTRPVTTDHFILKRSTLADANVYPAVEPILPMSRADPDTQQNVLGSSLEPCSQMLSTGYQRDGHCTAVPGDRGSHHLCAEVTQDFLEFSRERGNDLITPRPDLDFPGLNPGDRWCLCVGRWLEAREAGVAPPVVLEATNETVLEDVDLETLKDYAVES